MDIHPAFDFDRLPVEILIKIIKRLDLRSLFSILQVNKHFNTLDTDNFMWKRIYKKRFDIHSPFCTLSNETNWKAKYQQQAAHSKLRWVKHSSNLELSNNGLTIHHGVHGGYSTAVTCVPVRVDLDNSSFYWEATIDNLGYYDPTSPDVLYDDHIFIGATTDWTDKDTGPSADLRQNKNTWIYLIVGKKCHSSQIAKYGEKLQNGDVLGVLLTAEHGRQGVSMSFFKNGVNMGVAFTGLPAISYPIIGITYYQGQITTQFCGHFQDKKSFFP
jgi:hypothetical protein